MIFLSVGTHNEPFDRLLKEVDRLVEEGGIRDKIVAQIGHSDYLPKNYPYFRFTSWKRIQQLNKAAEIVITHGGAGNLILASRFGKAIVAVPRMRRFGEHVNDHQLQLVKELAKQGKVIPVYGIKDLKVALKKAKTLKSRQKKLREERKLKLISLIRSYLEGIAKKKNKGA